MNTLRNVVLASLVAASIGIVGCDKKVNLVFVNGTSQTREVELNAPGAGVVSVGVVPGGGRLSYPLKFTKDELPANCSWKAGDQTGAFTVDKNTPKDLRVVIGPVTTVGPIKKGDEVRQQQQIEIKDIPVEQHEVVE